MISTSSPGPSVILGRRRKGPGIGWSNKRFDWLFLFRINYVQFNSTCKDIVVIILASVYFDKENSTKIERKQLCGQASQLEITTLVLSGKQNQVDLNNNRNNLSGEQSK